MTEWISNVNIPHCQLLIGMGIALNRIPDIRRLYGLEPMGDSPIDFDNDSQAQPLGMGLRNVQIVNLDSLLPHAHSSTAVCVVFVCSATSCFFPSHSKYS